MRVTVRRDRHVVEVGGAQSLHFAEGEAFAEAEADGIPRRCHREDSSES